MRVLAIPIVVIVSWFGLLMLNSEINLDQVLNIVIRLEENSICILLGLNKKVKCK